MFNKQEYSIYAVVWIIIFLAPVLGHFVFTSVQSVPFDWHDVWRIWGALALYLVVFIIHDLLVAPLLARYGKKQLYVVATLALVTAGFAYNFSHRPDRQGPPLSRTERRSTTGLPPRPPLGMHEIMSLAMLVTTIGANIGLKLFFKSQLEQQRIDRERTAHLQQELEYLRYQVNPHFLMNTLNNIHALVDIDPARAKQSVVELSKMLRYVLYGTDTRAISLEEGFRFLTHYLDLMRLRHDENKVNITLDVPDPLPNVWMPPLLLIPFIENACVQGISYNSDSFIHASLNVSDGMIHFNCRNSIPAVPRDKHGRGGIGVTNVTRRLDLLFGKDNYTLSIGPDPTAPVPTYDVSLSFPASES